MLLISVLNPADAMVLCWQMSLLFQSIAIVGWWNPVGETVPLTSLLET